MGANKEKKKTSDIVITIIIIMVVIAFIGAIALTAYNWFHDDGNDATIENTQLTDIGKILNRNLETNYPASPDQVVDLYCQITMALHSKEIDEDDVEPLYKQLRALYFEDLVDYNNYDEQLKNLRKEIKFYQDKERRIVSYEVDPDKDMAYDNDTKGNERCRVIYYYSMKEKSDWMDKQIERAVLRKDKKGNWKIYGNEPVGKKGNTDEK